MRPAQTPPSLKWLIVRRGRIDGEILKIEKQLLRKQNALAEYQKKIETLSSALSLKAKDLKDTRDAIDKTLLLHDIQIDPANIRPIRPQEVKRDMHFGELTKIHLSPHCHGQWSTGFLQINR